MKRGNKHFSLNFLVFLQSAVTAALKSLLTSIFASKLSWTSLNQVILPLSLPTPKSLVMPITSSRKWKIWVWTEIFIEERGMTSCSSVFVPFGAHDGCRDMYKVH